MDHRTEAKQVQIQDWVKGGPASEALEAFGFLMLIYSFSHILETLLLLFLASILTPKVDKNRALEFMCGEL